MRPRVFCQNSGACGSTYIIQLLHDNQVERCFHELEPDFNELGVQHFDQTVSQERLLWLLRYTRHDVFFEASNRLFSFGRELKAAFPNAKFIHLHRHPAESIRSAMSKPNVESYLADGPRFQGTLAGPKSASHFERFCHYWNNVNRRIADDLKGEQVLSLKFDKLIAGDLDDLEAFLGVKLHQRTRAPVNTGKVRSEGKYPPFDEWDAEHKERFHKICGNMLERLGYQA